MNARLIIAALLIVISLLMRRIEHPLVIHQQYDLEPIPLSDFTWSIEHRRDLITGVYNHKL